MVRTVIGLVLALALLASACGGGDEAPAKQTPSQTQTPAPEPTPAPPPPAPAPEPEPDPVALAPGDASLGATVYAQNCVTCHGAKGDGDGPLSQTLDPRPARHSDGAYMNKLDDAYLFQVIRDGGAAVGKSALMAPWGGMLGDAEIANVVAFVRSLADPPYQAPAK